ncbi:hypothetical protein Trydic_g9161 [Trypoxylus dichotomus]
MSTYEKAKIGNQLEDWLRIRIIRPNYRNLNKQVVKDRYLLSLIKDQLDKLQEVRAFSVTDFRNHIFHVPVNEESSKYTALVIHVRWPAMAETELHTDASKYGTAAILAQRSLNNQKYHPIYYYRRKSLTVEQKYTSYELQVLTIITAVSKFWCI